MISEKKVKERFETTITLIASYITVVLLFVFNIKLILNFWVNVLNNISWLKGKLLVYSTIAAYAVTLIVAVSIISNILCKIFKKILKRKYRNLNYIILGAANFIFRIHMSYFVIIFVSMCVTQSLDGFENSKLSKLISVGISKLYESDVANLVTELNSKVLYNGTPIEDAVKSSDEIKNEVVNLIKGCTTDREKAKKIYDWVGTNITYDVELSQNLDNEIFNNAFGARYAYDNRSGVCFDFASLYAVMAMESDMKVRLVIGKAFDGNSFGAHAWNEVFLADEDKWIDVDATFWGHDDSFDSDCFEETHIAEEVAGEW